MEIEMFLTTPLYNELSRFFMLDCMIKNGWNFYIEEWWLAFVPPTMHPSTLLNKDLLSPTNVYHCITKKKKR